MKLTPSSNMMKFKVFHPTSSVSLGETRGPRMLEKLQGYSIEKSNQGSSRPTILIAEDDDDSRCMMRTLLEMKGYRVVEARSGEEAVEVALLKRPDLVLLDLELRGLDGIKVTRDLRLKGKTGDVPIVIISGLDPAERKDAAFAAGCNEYLLKPIDFDHLDGVLNRYVPLSSATKSTPRIP